MYNIVNFGIYQFIEFDKVFLNDGNGYLIYFGYFVVLVFGFYVFVWIILFGDCICMKYDVVKNSVVLIYYISDVVNYFDWVVLLGIIVIWMNLGDCVWI